MHLGGIKRFSVLLKWGFVSMAGEIVLCYLIEQQNVNICVKLSHYKRSHEHSKIMFVVCNIWDNKKLHHKSFSVLTSQRMI